MPVARSPAAQETMSQPVTGGLWRLPRPELYLSSSISERRLA